ncbi:WXG100 family type VII secretion target [Kitasatospora sp. RB6PN24]|uniref:WXG100 family type VII secretion target n=1 Tax=Kitasatospora humi TaxID=2893891 RepID=UPI001E5E6B3E|nr:WXG100 family type VII secretion target [Kitasatospora humi]MCC9308689.1 WXG100 family type VII secretion target [Kitasatospora humi]
MKEPDRVGSDDAYAWISATPAPPTPLPLLPASDPGAIGSGIDSVVKGVLEATGLLDRLDGVTGQPQALMAAAQGWQDQAAALREVAEALRRGAAPVARQWHGKASNAFGTRLGRVVEAIDATADDADATAGLLGSAAAECRFAENAVIAVIREAIEWIAVTLAAGAIADFLTMGLATIVDTLVAEEEMAVFIARVSAVSERLGEALKELDEALKAMREAEGVCGAYQESKDVRTVIKALRTGGKVAWNPLTYPAAYTGSNLAGQLLFKPLTAGLTEPLVKAVTGMTGDPGSPARGLISDAGERAGDPPPPYHVPGSRAERAPG